VSHPPFPGSLASDTPAAWYDFVRSLGDDEFTWMLGFIISESLARKVDVVTMVSSCVEAERLFGHLRQPRGGQP